MLKYPTLSLLCMALAGSSAYAARFSSSPLDTLQSQHPRLFLHASDLPILKHAIQTDPFLKVQYQQLLARGNELLTRQPEIYAIGGPEHTLLSTSREIERRVVTLAGLYRITGDSRYADRAIQEMLAASAFPDWYPTHFLDTGEMTAALGIGYDWLYSVLAPRDRATIENAIATKGIDPWIERIRSGESARHERNNWNQVCNGGETIGALAIADEDPGRALQILNHARAAIAAIMKLFAPDGGFEEGPTYWGYATIYNVLYLDALDTALGTDFGVSEAPGFSSTGDYHIQSEGPTGMYANFGDAGSGPATPSAQMFWLARRFNKPFYAEYERHLPLRAAQPGPEMHDRFAFFLILWAAEGGQVGPAASLPLIQGFTRVGQAFMRSDWNDANAWYVGFKGGDLRASHGHLDLGTFVLDAFGQRWAVDLGPDSYGLPGYFGKQRWDYYRTRTEGHNTLTVDGGNQDLDAKGPLMAVGDYGGRLLAVADLSEAYKGKLSSWQRGVALVDRKMALVQDEIRPRAPADVVWSLHAYAKVRIATDGRSATLSQGDAQIEVRILSPAGARFAITAPQAPPPQAANGGVSNLTIPLPKEAGMATIAVLFSRPGEELAPRISPLAAWK